MRKAIVVVVATLCFASLFAFAADPPKKPTYIWVQSVAIAEGKSESYPGLVAQYRRAAENAKADNYWLAATSLTGDLRQATFVSVYDSFAAAEKDILGYQKISTEAKKINPNFLAEASAAELEPHGAIAVLRDDLSYQPDKVPTAMAKWWRVKTIHLAPGHRTQFAELMKAEIDMLTKAKVDESFAVYEVVAGVPTTGQVYYIVAHMKSLADMDVDYSEQVKAVFTPMIQAQFESIVQKIVTKAEDNLYMVRPDMSRPPQSFVAANPEFWTIKEQEPVAAKGKAKKPAIEAGNLKPTPKE